MFKYSQRSGSRRVGRKWYAKELATGAGRGRVAVTNGDRVSAGDDGSQLEHIMQETQMGVLHLPSILEFIEQQ